MQRELFRSFKESAQLESKSDSGSEELFSSQQRRDCNTHEYPSRDLSSLEYLKQQYGDQRGCLESVSGYCTPPTARIPASGSQTSGIFRSPFSQSDDFARQSETAIGSNTNTKVQLSSLSAFIPNGNVVNSLQLSAPAGSPPTSSESSSVKTPSVSARIPGTSQVGLSSDEESSGRVRFLSARLPATGKGNPGVFSGSGETIDLKPILKKGRSPKATSGSSSDQEHSPHNRNVRILDPGIANIAEMFSQQASHVTARIPGTPGVNSCVGGRHNQRNENVSIL